MLRLIEPGKPTQNAPLRQTGGCNYFILNLLPPTICRSFQPTGWNRAFSAGGAGSSPVGRANSFKDLRAEAGRD